jgi:hypothetical protein
MPQAPAHKPPMRVYVLRRETLEVMGVAVTDIVMDMFGVFLGVVEVDKPAVNEPQLSYIKRLLRPFDVLNAELLESHVALIIEITVHLRVILKPLFYPLLVVIAPQSVYIGFRIDFPQVMVMLIAKIQINFNRVICPNLIALFIVMADTGEMPQIPQVDDNIRLELPGKIHYQTIGPLVVYREMGVGDDYP